jgi:hypothetical protein
MRINKLDTHHPVARLLGQLMVLAAALAYIWYLYSTQVLPNQTIRTTFRETSCFITSKKLSTRHHFFRSYRADFLVSYRGGAAQYTRWVSGNGINQAYRRHSSEEKEILSSYEIGETYLCWFDPDNPQVVALVLRDYPLYSFAIPVIIAAFVLYSLIFRKLLGWRANTLMRSTRVMEKISNHRKKKRRQK